MTRPNCTCNHMSGHSGCPIHDGCAQVGDAAAVARLLVDDYYYNCEDEDERVRRITELLLRTHVNAS